MSWELIGAERVIKTMELTDFKRIEMVIPKELHIFFGSVGDRLAIIYQNREYPAYLEAEDGNVALKWSKVLIRKLGEAFPDYESWFQGDPEVAQTPRLELTKINDVFSLRLIIKDEETESDDSKESEISLNLTPAASGLRELLIKWITGYPNYYPRDFRFSFKDLINEEIPKLIESFETIRSGHYQVQGFAGDTQWAEIPWVKVKNQRINHEDLYLAYLLAKDSRKLYLAIVYGKEGMGIRSLSEQAAEYRKRLATGNYQTNHKEVLLANASLVFGIVCYREYTETDMPEDEVLAEEFEDFIKLYEWCLTADQGVEPSPVSDESIEEISDNLNTRVAVKTVMAGQIIEVGTDQIMTEKKLEETTGSTQTESFVVTVEDLDAILPNEEIISKEILHSQTADDGEEQSLADLERGETANIIDSTDQQESQNQAETLSDREEAGESASQADSRSSEKQKTTCETGTDCKLTATEAEQATAQNIFDQSETEAVANLTRTLRRHPIQNDYLSPALQLVQAKMGSKGYYYPTELIKNYYLSLKSKPFVMIKGRVGSGKTSFPRLFAEAVGATPENGRFKRLLVGKGWDDPAPLLGHLDSRGHFIPGPIMQMLKVTKEYPDKPHFFLLDEMDQSPTEAYLQLLLEGVNGNKEPFLTREDFGSDITAFREYGSLSFPDNLYIIATINEGLGSFPIPERVIDSGNLIQMPVVEIGIFPDYGSPAGNRDWENSAFKIHSQAKGLPEILERLMNLLNGVQQLLIEYGCPIGYRGKNEILAYGINSGAEGLFNEREVIDLAIVQRILPMLALDKQVGTAVYQELACFLLDETLRQNLLGLPLDRFISGYQALLKAEVIPCHRSGQAVLKRLKTKS